MFMEQYKEYSTVVLRVFFGLAFLIAGGLFKLTHLEPVGQLFTNLFGGAGMFLMWVTIIVEIVLGFTLLIGYQTRWSASILAVVILVALVKTWSIASGDFLFALKEIAVMNTGGGNIPVNLAYLAGLISLALSGSETLAVRPE